MLRAVYDWVARRNLTVAPSPVVVVARQPVGAGEAVAGVVQGIVVGTELVFRRIRALHIHIKIQIGLLI